MRTALLAEHDFTTWSGNINLAANLGASVRVEGEVFVGLILGDYKAGILHTFNPIREIGIRTTGGWAQLQYQINPKLSVAGGYALDDTFSRDLSARLPIEKQRDSGKFLL